MTESEEKELIELVRDKDIKPTVSKFLMNKSTLNRLREEKENEKDTRTTQKRDGCC